MIQTWLQGRVTIQQAEIQTKLAKEQNNARLMADTASYNNAWEQAELLQTDKWLRRACFTIFSAPFVIAMFWPDSVNYYFTVALDAVPRWYFQTYMGIVGALWGIASLKPTIQSLWGKK